MAQNVLLCTCGYMAVWRNWNISYCPTQNQNPLINRFIFLVTPDRNCTNSIMWLNFSKHVNSTKSSKSTHFIADLAFMKKFWSNLSIFKFQPSWVIMSWMNSNNEGTKMYNLAQKQKICWGIFKYMLQSNRVDVCCNNISYN